MPEFTILWVLGGVVVGWAAHARYGVGGAIGWFVASLILSPLITFTALMGVAIYEGTELSGGSQ